MRACHSHIGLIGSSVFQNLLIRGHHVRVSAQHRRRPSVQVAPQQLFLARRLGLESGLMIVQYTAAALVNDNKGLAWPSSAD